MAEKEITIDLSDTINMLQGMQGRLQNTEAMNTSISELMLSDISQHFEDEQGPNGADWVDLADSTIQQRKKKGRPPFKKLQVRSRESGLLGSLQSVSTKNLAAVTTNKKYAAIHHFGGNAGPGRKVRIPARPFAYLSQSAIEQIQETITDHILL